MRTQPVDDLRARRGHLAVAFGTAAYGWQAAWAIAIERVLSGAVLVRALFATRRGCSKDMEGTTKSPSRQG
jgi:hypothetical protein